MHSIGSSKFFAMILGLVNVAFIHQAVVALLAVEYIIERDSILCLMVENKEVILEA